MVYQFEGKTEKEAIENAARELGLEKDKFDVEIVETQKGGFFKKGFVRIEVHTEDGAKKGGGYDRPDRGDGRQTARRSSYDERCETRGRDNRGGRTYGGRAEQGSSRASGRDDSRGAEQYEGQIEGQNIEQAPGLPPENDFEKSMIEYLTVLIQKMGCDGIVEIQFRETGKTGFRITSRHSATLIGKKGKNLDALQLIANIYAGRIGEPDIHIVLDSENYRLRREEAIVRMAYNVADRVRSHRSSLLLEPMNPFERRIVHTTLSEVNDVITYSEGEGMYKQVRVSFRGQR